MEGTEYGSRNIGIDLGGKFVGDSGGGRPQKIKQQGKLEQ